MNTPDVYQSTTLEQLRALVAHVSEQCPALATRAEKAAHILLANKCAPITETRYEVTASDGSGFETYAVDVQAEYCPCKDREYRGVEWNGGRWCKHLLSVLMLRKLGTRSRPSARLERVRRFRPAATRRPARLMRKAA
jgi:hypothetical protein